MAATVHKTSRADADIAGAILWLLDKNPAAATKFVEDLEILAARLGQFPEIYPAQRRSTKPEWQRVRMAVLRRFRYLVFYTYENNIVVIRRVVHSARNEP